MSTTLLITALALTAPALKDKPKANTIVGEWVALEGTAGGRPLDFKTGEVRWIFKADGTRTIVREGKAVYTGQFTADSKASPATLDLDRGIDGNAVYLCIYKIEGDTLILNIGWQKTPRPSEFASPVDSECTLYVFKRLKKE